MTNPSVTATETTAPSVAHMDALADGTRLAEFELQGLLGVGGFGMVYRAYDHSLHRTVAIKEYMPSALAGRHPDGLVTIRSAPDQDTYRAGLNSFVAEARLLARFDHPSLVKVYRFWEANNTAYMVMPLYSGVTLKQARSQMSGPPPEAWLRTVLWSVLQGLQVLHDNSTMHRDVSPDNIFLQDVGPPVLLDLGAARRAITDKSHKHTAILKVNYAPIEQFAQEDDLRQGAWTDLYSLAAVVYGCVCNEPPTPATTRVVRDRMPSMVSVRDTVKTHMGQDYSDAFVKAIDHALAIHPADRPQTVAALVADMQLEASENLARFDWRAELGSELLPTMNSSSAALWQTQVLTVPEVAIPTMTAAAVAAPASSGTAKRVASTTPSTVDFQVTTKYVAAAINPTADHPPQAVAQSASNAAGGGQRKPLLWLAVAAAVAVLTGLGYWGLSGANKSESAPVVAAPEPAAVPGGKVAKEVGKEVGKDKTPVSLTTGDGAAGAKNATPKDSKDSKDSKAASAGGVATPKPAATKTSPTNNASTLPANSTTVKDVRPSQATEPAPASADKPVSKPASKTATEHPAAASGGKSESASAASKELCGSSNFLTRAMCIHLECKKPEYAKLAVCIEDHQRYPQGK